MTSLAGDPSLTVHRVLCADARDLSSIADESVDLVVTSPPYPMIEMWDGLFMALCGGVGEALGRGDGWAAFEAMHRELDAVWREVYRVLREGGFACVNIGDATRSVEGRFRLYPNHARILTAAAAIGFDTLPAILWRKPTNAPNKFMGSGMLPAGAYVTLEHEYVLVLRKGAKRQFADTPDRERRARSALFWEERNQWYSDMWDLRGVRQELGRAEMRKRSGSFPFELAYRLVCMYSVQRDTVLDPFLGLGTTSVAALAAGRSSLGIELDPAIASAALGEVAGSAALANQRSSARLEGHEAFLRESKERGRILKHECDGHGFPVMTRQERELTVERVTRVARRGTDAVEAEYARLGREDLPERSEQIELGL